MRVKGGSASWQRRHKILRLAKGFRGARSKLIRTAVVAVERSLKYAYRDRKQRKRQFRELWIVRISAAARENGVSYSRFMGALRQRNIEIDRKMLADLAVHDSAAFKAIVHRAMD